jgi:hypothetical protein
MSGHTFEERAERLGIAVEDFAELRAASMKLGKPLAPRIRRRAPARATQADVARAIRAAKQTGAGSASSVQILPDGTIRIDVVSDHAREKPKPVKLHTVVL